MKMKIDLKYFCAVIYDKQNELQILPILKMIKFLKGIIDDDILRKFYFSNEFKIFTGSMGWDKLSV